MNFHSGKEPSVSPDLAAVRRINERWIVRGLLRENTRNYLDHLAVRDPERLLKSCEIAMKLIHSRDKLEDPKALFYAGLFSLATRAEAELYLAKHWLTATVCHMLRGESYESSHTSANCLANDLALRIKAVMKDI